MPFLITDFATRENKCGINSGKLVIRLSGSRITASHQILHEYCIKSYIKIFIYKNLTGYFDLCDS
jgi:hypothetical protein